MRLEDLTPEDISSIIRLTHPDFPRSNFLGKGADGSVFVDPNDSSKVVKFAIGKESAYKNEIDNLFEAQLREMDTPAIYESGFTPTYEGGDGYSYINMDKMDFDSGYQNSNVSKLRKAQSLARLFGIGIDHGDMHNGNIRYDAASDSPVIIDFSRAGKLDSGLSGIGKRDRNVLRGLKAGNDKDIYKIYKATADKLSSEAFGSQDPNDIAAYRDFIDQAEGILERTEPGLERGMDANTPFAAKIGQSSTPNSIKLSIDENQINKYFGHQGRLIDGKWFPFKTDAPVPAKLKGSALTGALSVGAADLIPSRESIRMAGDKGIMPALRNHATEFALSLPIAGAVGFTAAAVPAIGTAATAAGPGLVALAAGEAADEVVTQATGEGIIPKFQQAIGTKPRTGIASPGGSIEETNKREMDRVFNPPEIKPMTQPPKRRPLSSSPMPALGHRLRLAGDRFNPSKGEFGISELLFGR